MSARLGVDGRIFFATNRQLSAIRTQDIPMLTLAICGFERGLVNVERCYKKQVAYFRFFAKEQRGGGRFEFTVLSNDWAKILPYLSGQPGGTTPGPSSPLLLDPVNNTNPKDLSNLEQWDPVFYKKVYATLQTIFTESYPTSKL